MAASFVGGPDAGENPVTLRRDGDSLSISGGAGGAVTVTYESGESWTVEVKTDAPLTITADGENAPSSTDDGLPFSDVDPGAWYADAVAWAVERGITTGTSATAFSPDRPCTRAEIVTMIWRTLGLDGLSAPTGDNPFRDVDEDAWYYEAVLWAAQNGITTGTSADTFSPDAVCTRAEVVTFLWRVDFPPKQLTGTPAFKDVFRGDYFWFPVIWALDREITTGTSADTFSPHLLCTRAQVVTFLYRDFKDSV